jgi:hypothetical protein
MQSFQVTGIVLSPPSPGLPFNYSVDAPAPGARFTLRTGG